MFIILVSCCIYKSIVKLVIRGHLWDKDGCFFLINVTSLNEKKCATYSQEYKYYSVSVFDKTPTNNHKYSPVFLEIELSCFASVIDTGDYFFTICMILMFFILIDGMIDYCHGY